MAFYKSVLVARDLLSKKLPYSRNASTWMPSLIQSSFDVDGIRRQGWGRQWMWRRRVAVCQSPVIEGASCKATIPELKQPRLCGGEEKRWWLLGHWRWAEKGPASGSRHALPPSATIVSSPTTFPQAAAESSPVTVPEGNVTEIFWPEQFCNGMD
uniref:Uncharacterized protein n=1 Tax=Oryza barthii TaxID=65489 RepID=A0A0D3HAY8_9ORYZ